MMQDDEDALRMAQKRKAGYDKKQAQATKEKGLLIINTGTGKGKTTAAFGMGLRVLGHGFNLGVVQFIKGAQETAERQLLGNFPQCTFKTMGDGFTWITQDRAQDIHSAQQAWAEAAAMLKNPDFRMVILDELNVILKYEYLDLNTVLATLQARPPLMHVVITGRHAPQALIDAADLVSDIRPIKHPYKDQGVKAQAGVEF